MVCTCWDAFCLTTVQSRVHALSFLQDGLNLDIFLCSLDPCVSTRNSFRSFRRVAEPLLNFHMYVLQWKRNCIEFNEAARRIRAPQWRSEERKRTVDTAEGEGGWGEEWNREGATETVCVSKFLYFCYQVLPWRMDCESFDPALTALLLMSLTVVSVFFLTAVFRFCLMFGCCVFLLFTTLSSLCREPSGTKHRARKCALQSYCCLTNLDGRFRKWKLDVWCFDLKH